ncbi:MAG: hypothetical protein Q4D31_01025 [Eubacteriales bacterium]|nr:hypothetical protein [Eubacteriales bacterium]
MSGQEQSPLKLLRGHYAYQAIAGALVLRLAVPDNWMLQIVAFALLAGGALSLQQASRWFLRASIAADVCIGFALLTGAPVLPPSLLRIALEYAALVPLLLAGCMLLLGYREQSRALGRSTAPEWIGLVVWSAGYILALLIAPGWLNDRALALAVTLANTLTVAGLIALLLDTFRAQKGYIRMEGDRP